MSLADAKKQLQTITGHYGIYSISIDDNQLVLHVSFSSPPLPREALDLVRKLSHPYDVVERREKRPTKRILDTKSRAMRIYFSDGNRHLVKYKIVTSSGEVLPEIYDAALLDLSESGARLLGSLPPDISNISKLKCNIMLGTDLVRVVANLVWKNSMLDEHQFGVQFEHSQDAISCIKKYIIRHQIDTRRLKASNNDLLNLKKELPS